MSVDDFGSLAGARGDGPLHRLDARIKLLAAVAFVVAVAAVPLGSWPALGVLALILGGLIVLSGASPLRLLARWLGFLLLVGFLAALTAGGRAAASGMSWGMVVLNLLAKNSLAFLMMMVLAEVTPWNKLLGGMRRLGAPPVLIATLGFMQRYIFVLSDELGRMLTARRARSFRGRGGLGPASVSNLIGVLLIRALEREERVHAAMTARGWDGTMRPLDD